jgi:hypothetical protein
MDGGAQTFFSHADREEMIEAANTKTFERLYALVKKGYRPRPRGRLFGRDLARTSLEAMPTSAPFSLSEWACCFIRQHLAFARPAAAWMLW